MKRGADVIPTLSHNRLNERQVASVARNYKFTDGKVGWLVGESDSLYRKCNTPKLHLA